MKNDNTRTFCAVLSLGGPALLMFVLPSLHKLTGQMQSRSTRLAKIGLQPEGSHDPNKRRMVFQDGEAPLLKPHEYVEQQDVHIQAGDDVKLYAIGSSSLVWMTWVDQLHLLLRRLGYSTPVVSARYEPRFYPKTVPQCDDTEYFEYLKTARFARIGWSSWDFAYDGWNNCTDGFRDINGHRVKCQHGPGCHYSQNPLFSSLLADDASQSTVTLLATWFNDFEQYWSHFKCFGNISVSTDEIVKISIINLKRNIREIHSKNPKVWILIMAKYTQQSGHITPDWLREVNRKVQEAVEQEHRTLFVYYELPPDKVAHMYQVAHPGHPNCRGSKIMAHAIVERLYKAKVIGRTIKLVDQETNVVNKNCSSLSDTVCHTSAMCWLDPVSRMCKPYSTGSADFHTVCDGSICEGALGSMMGA